MNTNTATTALNGQPSLRSVAVLINPASGRDQPILAPINRAFARATIDWWPYVMRPQGEAEALADALRHRPDAIAVFGGDGTVSNVASALIAAGAGQTLLGVLGGGTANAIAETLGVPDDLETAVTRICRGEYCRLVGDVGMVGERAFLLRASIGATAGLTENTTREEKDRLGLWAYVLSGLRALGENAPQRFTVVVDGAATEHDAISVIVAKSPGTGVRLALASGVAQEDRQLHVFVVPSAAWAASALANAALGDGLMDGCERFSGREISVTADEPVTVHLDGELLGKTPVSMRVQPAALNLIQFAEGQPEEHSGSSGDAT
jgi:YegS/Rv2252/BmrU family lipid kinase